MTGSLPGGVPTPEQGPSETQTGISGGQEAANETIIVAADKHQRDYAAERQAEILASVKRQREDILKSQEAQNEAIMLASTKHRRAHEQETERQAKILAVAKRQREDILLAASRQRHQIALAASRQRHEILLADKDFVKTSSVVLRMRELVSQGSLSQEEATAVLAKRGVGPEALNVNGWNAEKSYRDACDLHNVDPTFVLKTLSETSTLRGGGKTLVLESEISENVQGEELGTLLNSTSCDPNLSSYNSNNFNSLHAKPVGIGAFIMLFGMAGASLITTIRSNSRN